MTTQLARALTELNLARVANFKEGPPSGDRTLKKEDFLYVCVSGLPPIPNEFDHLPLPGEKLFIYP